MQYFPDKTAGFSIIEILVSLVVLSIALLGVGGLQMVAVKGTQDAHLRTQASIAAMNLSSKMRGNIAGVTTGAYGSQTDVDCSNVVTSCINNFCTNDEVAAYDLYQVACGNTTDDVTSGGVAQTLPGGKLRVTCENGVCNASTIHNIIISWMVNENTQKTNSLRLEIQP